jgi:hypothetical protein
MNDSPAEQLEQRGTEKTGEHGQQNDGILLRRSHKSTRYAKFCRGNNKAQP